MVIDSYRTDHMSVRRDTTIWSLKFFCMGPATWLFFRYRHVVEEIPGVARSALIPRLVSSRPPHDAGIESNKALDIHHVSSGFYRPIQLNSTQGHSSQQLLAAKSSSLCFAHGLLSLLCGSPSVAPIGSMRRELSRWLWLLVQVPAWSSPTGCREDGRNAQGGKQEVLAIKRPMRLEGVAGFQLKC